MGSERQTLAVAECGRGRLESLNPMVDNNLIADLGIEEADVETLLRGAFGDEVADGDMDGLLKEDIKSYQRGAILQGKVVVIDEFNGRTLIEAPVVLTTEAGTKRGVEVLEDTVWITVHATDKTDLDEIEAELISPIRLNLLEGHSL